MPNNSIFLRYIGIVVIVYVTETGRYTPYIGRFHLWPFPENLQ
jgi:hypothetical protein